jgi:adenylate kinase
MATAKQIQYRLGQAKKKLAKLNKDVTATKSNVKKLETQLKKAKAAEKAKKKKAPKKKVAKKRVAKRKPAKKRAKKKK